MKHIFLGIGSNLGNRKNNILKAIKYLSLYKGIIIKKKASIIETNAVSQTNQPDFLNTVIEIETSLSPDDLLIITKNIENKLKRAAKGDYGPRTIDIDILFYGNEFFVSNDLTIPHPLLHERIFVLKPLSEIAPDFIHPALGETINKIYKDLAKWDN